MARARRGAACTWDEASAGGRWMAGSCEVFRDEREMNLFFSKPVFSTKPFCCWDGASSCAFDSPVRLLSQSTCMSCRGWPLVSLSQKFYNPTSPLHSTAFPFEEVYSPLSQCLCLVDPRPLARPPSGRLRAVTGTANKGRSRDCDRTARPVAVPAARAGTEGPARGGDRGMRGRRRRRRRRL